MKAITKPIVLSISGCLLLLFASYAGNAQKTSPKAQFPGRFKQVQLSRLYDDNKVFPDLIPLHAPDSIMEKYKAETARSI